MFVDNENINSAAPEEATQVWTSHARARACARHESVRLPLSVRSTGPVPLTGFPAHAEEGAE